LLHYYTRLLHWRRDQIALVKGSMQLLPLTGSVLAYVRAHASQSLLCLFNFSQESVAWDLPPAWATAKAVSDSPVRGGEIVGGKVQLQPWGGVLVSA
jgi:alpha-glucosidase